MKAVIARSWDPATFRVEDVPEPIPGDGEIVIAVHTAPIALVDVLVAIGRYQVRPAFPFTPGSECAGVITACGAGVDGFKVGDAVLAQGFIGNGREERRTLGSFAE